jgi:hypothetical protein
MKKMINNRFLFVTGLVFVAAIFRLIPHLPNFTPVASMALFGGALYSGKWKAFLIPLLALFVSDLIIGFHETMIFVYLGFLSIVGIGFWLKKALNVKNIIVSALLASIVFFLITNFGVWVMYDFYPKNFAGLIDSYLAAIPFMRNDILGNLFYSGVFFGAYYIIKAKYPQLVYVK